MWEGARRDHEVLAWLALVSVLVPAPRVHAQALTENDFHIDLVTGPVLGSSRVVGMGGAHTALATGIGASPWNPAAYGSRTLYEMEWFQWELALSVLLPGAFSQNDFFNNDLDRGLGVSDFVFADLGLRFQFGRFGLGALGRVQVFSIPRATDVIDVVTVAGHYGGALMLLEGQLVIGLGARSATMSLGVQGGDDLIQFKGTAGEAGVLLRPHDRPYRLGLAARLLVRSRPLDRSSVTPVGGVDRAGGFVLPKSVRVPAEVRAGFAWQFGDRPLNRRWTKPEDPEAPLLRELEARWCARELEQLAREARAQSRTLPPGRTCPNALGRPADPEWWADEKARRKQEKKELEAQVEVLEDAVGEARKAAYEALPRRYWLLAADVLLIARTPSGIGIDAFLDQERRRAGAHPSFGVRLGVETEPWLDRLKLRAGTYLEPSRNQGVDPRIHGTLGFDLKLFTWDLFGLVGEFSLAVGAVADVAARYADYGFTVGLWH